MGVVTCFAADFSPKNWAYCNGQSLSIAQNQALFSLLGTTYGGNGTTTFNLPDLRGRTAISAGQGNGLANYTLGQPVGAPAVTMQVNNIPTHNHSGAVALRLAADGGPASQPDAEFGYPAQYNGAYSIAKSGTMGAPVYSNIVIGNTGNNQPIPIRPPYQVLNYIICMFGLFPSRN